MEAAHAELTKEIRHIGVNSVSISLADMSTLTSSIANSFRRMTAHFSTLFTETKKGEGQKKKPSEAEAGVVEIITPKNLLEIVESHDKRIDEMESFVADLQMKMDRKK